MEQGLANNYKLPAEPGSPRADDSAVRLLPLQREKFIVLCKYFILFPVICQVALALLTAEQRQRQNSLTKTNFYIFVHLS